MKKFLGMTLGLLLGLSFLGGIAQAAEPYTVAFAFPVTFNQAEMGLVEEAMNKMALEKVGVGIQLIPLSMGTYVQQINLMIASGEKLDLFIEYGDNFSTNITQGKLSPLEDVLEYMQDAVDVVTDTYWQTTMVNGKHYGILSITDLAKVYGFSMRKDIVEKYNIDPAAIKTWDDVGDLFQFIKENEPDLVPTQPNNSGVSMVISAMLNVDSLGDYMGVLLNDGQDELNVVNYFASEEYASVLARVRDWYEKGYILSDASTNPDTGVPLYKSGLVFSRLGTVKDTEATARDILGTSGQPTVAVQITRPTVNTSTASKYIMAIPVNCENLEASAKIINLFYTDSDFVNLIDYGIEGLHYERVEGSEKRIRLPEGVSLQESGYGLNMPYLFGNQFNSYMWEENSEDLYDKLDAQNKNAIVSKAMGFMFDSSSVKNAVTAVNNVLAEYRFGLENGELDPEVYLPLFLSALESSGINEVIAEKQAQLDAWAEVNGIR